MLKTYLGNLTMLLEVRVSTQTINLTKYDSSKQLSEVRSYNKRFLLNLEIYKYDLIRQITSHFETKEKQNQNNKQTPIYD